MCGRFSLGFPVPVVAEEFEVERVDCTLTPSYNIAPTQPVMAVVQWEGAQAGAGKADEGLVGGGPEQRPGGRVLTTLRWGLVPSWAKDPSIGARLINARAESAADKPSFRSAFRSRHCLIPASGFYEWRKARAGAGGARRAGGAKQPYHIGLAGKGLFGLAGLFESWLGPEGDELRTCTILTTAPNELIEPIHDRMPVIVASENRELWLDPAVQDPKALEPILVPYPAHEMEAYPVSKRVNSPTNQGAGLARPLVGLDLG